MDWWSTTGRGSWLRREITCPDIWACWPSRSAPSWRVAGTRSRASRASARRSNSGCRSRDSTLLRKPLIHDNRGIAANIGSLLDRGAADKAALIVPDGPTLTYGRLRELTEQVATALASSGVKPGDRVATVFPNGPEAVLTFLATSMIGVSCPLNPAYKEDEFRFYLEDTGARFLLVPRGEAVAARQALPAGGKLIEVDLDAAGRLQISSGGGARDGSLELANAGATALVLHTSGTTSAV